MKRRITAYAIMFLTAASSLAQTTIQFTAVHVLPSNEVELIWSSDANRWYAIERTADLTNWSYEFDFVIPDDSAPIESNHWALVADTSPCFFRIFASPVVGPQDVVYTSLGTDSNDTQTAIGTTNMDYVLQFGEGSNDNQYASTGENADWIAQFGGAGGDTQIVRAGSGRDLLWQDGGAGDDSQVCLGADGQDWILQRGGSGSDDISATGGDSIDLICQRGGADSDSMYVDGGDGDDQIQVFAGGGGDFLIYAVSDGLDTAMVDGGDDSDTLEVFEGNRTDLAIRLRDGTDLYTTGVPDTVITVMNLETVYAVDGDGITNWMGSGP